MIEQQPHIFLIGMMGSGKSSVGRVLAKLLRYSFLDLDTEIERVSAKTVHQIFTEDGEPVFRDLESSTAMQLDLSKPQVIATGGGFPLKKENLQWMRRNGIVIWLQADSSTILERIVEEDRPLLPQPLRLEHIETILNKRLPVYQQADISIDANDGDPRAIAMDIKDIIES